MIDKRLMAFMVWCNNDFLQWNNTFTCDYTNYYSRGKNTAIAITRIDSDNWVLRPSLDAILCMAIELKLNYSLDMNDQNKIQITIYL